MEKCCKHGSTARGNRDVPLPLDAPCITVVKSSESGAINPCRQVSLLSLQFIFVQLIAD